jgi:RimJ/RimL family protein N-acetyltransferase
MLHGLHVTLRPFREGDFDRYAEFRNDLEMQVLDGRRPNPVEVEGIRARFLEDVAKVNYDEPWFAIEIDGMFVGQCGLRNINSDARTWELGIGIGDRRYLGQGYGREAVQLLLEFAFRYRNMHRVWLTTSSDNLRAIRAYKACGFVEEGRQRQHHWSRGAYHDIVLMGILREEWQGQEPPAVRESERRA